MPASISRKIANDVTFTCRSLSFSFSQRYTIPPPVPRIIVTNKYH